MFKVVQLALYCPGVCSFCRNFDSFQVNSQKLGSSGATECRVWIGNCDLKVWKSTEHKLHKIWRSLKFCTNLGKRAHPRIPLPWPWSLPQPTPSVNGPPSPASLVMFKLVHYVACTVVKRGVGILLDCFLVPFLNKTRDRLRISREGVRLQRGRGHQSIMLFIIGFNFTFLPGLTPWFKSFQANFIQFNDIYPNKRK